jgi:polygalacturonase
MQFLKLAGVLAFLLSFGSAPLGTPILPTIPSGSTNIMSFGAVGDGTTTNTTAIQNAINAASAAGIGTVEIPAGTFLSGPLTMKSSLNLQIDAGAILRMLPYGQYPGGITSPANFISGSSLHDVEISGSGAIDGQGLPWWKISETNSAANRPVMVNLSACSRVLIQSATFSNSPSPHLVVKGKAGHVTIQGVNILAPSSGATLDPSHNTDAIDLAETNALIQNCYISVGDDNVAIGSSALTSSDILITNCAFGYGHGVSIGSFTSGGVSNLTVVNCSFTNTDQGVRIKSDRDRGGTVQNLRYANLTMTNVQYPILIYCSYTNTDSVFKSLNNITPGIAATYPSVPVTGTTPKYRDITLSNITGTAQSGRMAGLIWGLPESLVSNITLVKVQISGSKTLGIYYARAITFADSQITVPVGVNGISFYNAQISVTNSGPANLVTLDGVSTNGIGNTLEFWNAQGALKNTNALEINPVVKVAGGSLTISNHLSAAAAAQWNFVLGTNASIVNVRSNLVFDGTVNVTAGSGFSAGAYTLFNYGGTLGWGLPALGDLPAGFGCAFDTNSAGRIKLRTTSLAPVTLSSEPALGNQMRLFWPADHIGWRMQMQTNGPGVGLGANWFFVAASEQTNQIFLPVCGSCGSVFCRLVYP